MKTHFLSNCAILLISSLATPSCLDSDQPVVPTSYPPVIVIYDPDEGSTVKGGINISADISLADPNAVVQEVSVKITQDSDNTVVFQETPYLVGVQNFYSYHHTFTPASLASLTPMTLVVSGKSAGGNASKSVKFTAEP